MDQIRDGGRKGSSYGPREQRILTSEGAVFVVKAVVQDHLDPTFFMIQLVAEGEASDWLAEPIEVFESDWEEWILAQGAATLLPTARGQATRARRQSSA